MCSQDSPNWLGCNWPSTPRVSVENLFLVKRTWLVATMTSLCPLPGGETWAQCGSCRRSQARRTAHQGCELTTQTHQFLPPWPQLPWALVPQLSTLLTSQGHRVTCWKNLRATGQSPEFMSLPFPFRAAPSEPGSCCYCTVAPGRSLALPHTETTGLWSHISVTVECFNKTVFNFALTLCRRTRILPARQAAKGLWL